jgi:hypothetical protein
MRGGGVAGTVTLEFDSAAAGLSGVGWPAAGGAAERGGSLCPGGGRVSRLTGPGAVAVAVVGPLVASGTKRALGSWSDWPGRSV